MDFSTYDFIDFGCSKGGSIEFATRAWPGARGIGIDIDDKKVAVATAAGYSAVKMDALELQYQPDVVRFCTMLHFLEHLYSKRDAAACIRAACTAAREFVVIRHPWFGADSFLMAMGLKFYWSDWRGHRCHLDALQLQLIMRDLHDEGLITRFAIYGRKPVASSVSETIHSLASPIDQHGYDPARHPPKPRVNFPPGIFQEVSAIAVKNGDLAEVAKATKPGDLIYDSARP